MQQIKYKYRLEILAIVLIMSFLALLIACRMTTPEERHQKRSTVSSISATGTSKKTDRLISTVNMNSTG